MKQSRKIEVRIDAYDKYEFVKILRRTGLTISEAIRLFIKKTIIKNGIPFEIKTRRLPREEEDKLTPNEMLDYINNLTVED